MIVCLTFIIHTPLSSLQTHQFRDGTALHGLQTGIVIIPVRLEALDPQFLKRIDGFHKLGIIGGQRDVILIEQILVGHDGIHLGAHGQPADRTAVFTVHFKVA